MLLITGGRGHIAQALASMLHTSGHRVRLASRQPTTPAPEGIEVVHGDLSQPACWPAAMAGVTRAFAYPGYAGLDAFLGAAGPAGVDHIVLLSAAGVDKPEASSDDPIVAMHRRAEESVRASGLHWTVLRTSGFATNTLGWADQIRRTRRVRAPYPQSHAALIHERDIAAVAALVLTAAGSRHHGQIYELTGPQSVTQQHQADAIAAAIGEPVTFEEISEHEYRTTLSQWGDDNMVDTLIRHLRDADNHPARTTSTTTELLNQPSRSYRQWAIDHANEFH